ncbi:GNAT family N-acetyltransferase [Microbacterium sp. NPDC055903]
MSIPLTDTATLRPLVLPARADAAPSPEVRAYADVRNACLLEISGRDDDVLTAEALLPVLFSDADMDKRQWSIHDADEMIGVAVLNIFADEGGRTAFTTVNLLRRAWTRGIGTAALAHVEEAAKEAGVRRLLVWAEHHDGGEPSLASPTGFGSVPRDHVARFLLRHGYALEQVERVSALVWSSATATRLRELLSDAEQHAVGYRVVQWMLPTPPERVDGYAWMKHHMSTDAPDADLDMPAEVWDAERVSRHDTRYLQKGDTVLVTAAEHIATGELCAYNELAIGTDPASTTHQEDTLVLSSHRGHRLGTLVKAAGLLAWRGIRPASERVITYNAEENRPMLDINEALGFVPIGYEGAWKKDLA